MKPQIKFRLDYSCSPLWTNDEETRTKYDYNIDLKEIGLTTKTSEKAEIVVSMFYESLNPIYQGFPSFWREKLCVDFNQKVTDVYDSICMEIGNEFEIIDFTEKLSEDKRRSSFLNDPVDYCLQHGVRFRDGDELVKEVESEHIKPISISPTIERQMKSRLKRDGIKKKNEYELDAVRMSQNSLLGDRFGSLILMKELFMRMDKQKKFSP